MLKVLACAAALVFTAPQSVHAQAAKLNDGQIAHVAYTAGDIDVAAARQALAKSQNSAVRAFAEEMAEDHAGINGEALALLNKLGVTPEDNALSRSLAEGAAAKRQALRSLTGKAFDRAYVDNEVAYHRAVNTALHTTLIPDARDPQLKEFLETALRLFTDHQHHVERLAAQLR
jgi:putative membrane protein